MINLLITVSIKINNHTDHLFVIVNEMHEEMAVQNGSISFGVIKNW